jgi:hypothetical protein
MTDDAQTIYTLTHVEQLSPEAGNDSLASILTNSWVATMERSGFPYRTFNPEIEFLFYAYLSSCYLDSLSDRHAAPIKFGPSDMLMGDAKVPIEVERHSQPPHLPTRLFLFSPAGDRTNAVIQAWGFTNVAGVVLPCHVVLKRLKHGGDSILAIYEFKAEVLRSETAVASFTPQFPPRALVADHRFSKGKADVPPVTYGIRTGDWPSESEARNHPAFRANQMDWESAQQAGVKGQMQSGQAATRRKWVIVFLIFVSGWFLIFLYSFGRRQFINP